MRFTWLYLRSRMTGTVLAGISLAGLLALAWEHWFGHQEGAMMTALTFLPLVIACAIGSGTHSPFGEAELTASMPLPMVRSAHLAGLVVIGVMIQLVVARGWSLPDDAGTLTRNLAGLTGLALLTAPLVGGRLSWIAPMTLSMMSQLLDINDLTAWIFVTWPTAALENDRAMAISLALFGSGLVAISIFGPRLTDDESAR